MFEKEAEEYVIKKHNIDTTKQPVDFSLRCEFAEDFTDFQNGAEFGYNKANEQHFVKDELPELYKDVLVVFPRGDCDVKRLTNHNEWVSRGSWCSLTDVIAWKEIVLPELKESE